MESGFKLPAYQEPTTTSRIRRKRSNKKRRISAKFQVVHFKDSILRTKKVLTPKLKLNPLALHEIENFLSHQLETFDKDLKWMKKNMQKRKTLSISDLETVTKLCFPKLLADTALEYGRRAVEMYNNTL